MKRFTSDTQKVGLLGERLAERYLISHGFDIVERNATYKGGEIDLIAKKGGRIHFFEIKTSKIYVSRETTYNPFQNISSSKIHRMQQSAQIWLNNSNVSRETRWQMDALAVLIDQESKKSYISYIPNINI